jgi:hypothetical protein
MMTEKRLKIYTEDERREWSRKGGLAIKKKGTGIFSPENKRNKGKPHSEEHKRKIGKANSVSQKGSKNSQYGTRWITNGILNRKIKNGDCIPEGWVYGRTR